MRLAADVNTYTEGGGYLRKYKVYVCRSKTESKVWCVSEGPQSKILQSQNYSKILKPISILSGMLSEFNPRKCLSMVYLGLCFTGDVVLLLGVSQSPCCV